MKKVLFLSLNLPLKSLVCLLALSAQTPSISFAGVGCSSQKGQVNEEKSPPLAPTQAELNVKLKSALESGGDLSEIKSLISPLLSGLNLESPNLA